jgi:hypothetical protein
MRQPPAEVMRTQVRTVPVAAGRAGMQVYPSYLQRE